MKYEDKLEKLYEIKKNMKLVDYCRSMAACLTSLYGDEEEFCEDCAFKEYCVMGESPDTMLEGFLMDYESQVLEESKEYKDEIVSKYYKILEIVNDK